LPFGCNGCVTAVAAGQSQRFYSGVGIFNWHYLSSPPQVLRGPGAHLESKGLACYMPIYISLSQAAARQGSQAARQSPSFKANARETKDLRRRTEIILIPVKDPHTRIKSLALTNGHGRYITATPERALVSVGEWPLHAYNRYKFVTASLPKRLRNGRFTSETAVRRFRK
jgi:hypothetical protein